MYKIVGLMGVKGSGKDTAAHALIAKGYRRLAFAEALYQEAAQAFDVTVAYLGERSSKETDTRQLALHNCSDRMFVGCVLGHLGFTGASERVIAKQLSLPRSPRTIMQYWGTEYRRKGYPGVYVGDDSYWLNILDAQIKANPDELFVITDVRFKNEYAFVRNRQGSLVRVRRPALEAREAVERAASGAAAHASETDLLAVPVDVEVFNLEHQPDALQQAILAHALNSHENALA